MTTLLILIVLHQEIRNGTPILALTDILITPHHKVIAARNGWGQDPQPVIDYEPAAGHESEVFGAGEPCIVVKDDVVYLYYSYNDYLVESNGYCTTTRVSVASAKDENWPGHLEYKGIALDKSDAPRVWGRWLTWFQPLDWVDVDK